ncbi:MAG TPA: alpha/beta fold hydrolase [Prosthecobacter sp.]
MPSPADTVVLIHGLLRTPRSMWVVAAWLKRKGYRVLLVGYPSRKVPISEAVVEHIQPRLAKLAETLEPGTQVHFVTHSLGGIVFRAWAAQRDPAFPLGRAVLLAPPNRGSEIIDDVRQLPWARWLVGPVSAELGTDSDSTPNSLGPLPPNTGVIMGNRGRISLFKHLIGNQTDGIVTIDSARGEGAAGFTLLPTDHTFIVLQPAVLRAVHRFLRNGTFE